MSGDRKNEQPKNQPKRQIPTGNPGTGDSVPETGNIGTFGYDGPIIEKIYKDDE